MQHTDVKNTVIRNVVLHNMEEIYWHFGRTFCLSLFSVEAGNSFKTTVNCCRIAWHHTPEDGIPDG
jgi:hypothetical protein